MVVVSQDDKVRAEQIRMLYEAIPVSIVATLFVSLVLVFILLSSSIPRENLFIWLSLPFVFGFGRFVIYKKYLANKYPGDDELDKHERNIIIGTVLSALVWGSAPIVLHSDNITFQVVIAFALAGMSAGAVSSLSFRLSTIKLFLFISLIPLIIRFISNDSIILQAMGVMVIAHLVLLLISAKRIYVNTEQNIMLRLESDRREHELERIIAERERLDELKSDFISTVSHELRTPLTSIRGSLGLLIGGAICELPKQAKGVLAIAGNNTERLLLLINDLLDMQKVESGGLRFNHEPIEINQLLDNAIHVNEGLANEYGVSFSLKLCPEPVYIHADSNRLLQVMNNLLSNAAKYSHRNNAINVSCEVLNERVRILIADNGMGIPREFQKDVFNKFSQADTSDTKKVRGTGLGLSISKYIVEKHNGTIGFQSEEGVGSTFYVELPIFQESIDA